MKLLLDECVPRKLANQFSNHDVRTVPDSGFAGLSNGESLKVAERAGFDVLLTVDQGIQDQQNLRGRRIAIVVMTAKTDRLADLLPLVPEILKRIAYIRPGQLVRLGGS